ncbi:hypothetical protein LUZ60_010621 [Juncus effusus]|nr:hypothetical protein LUZ60_010621 [Juncus effusus]
MANHESLLSDKLKDAVGAFYYASMKLATPILKKFGSGSKPAPLDEEELEQLKSKLEGIRALLKEADRLSISDESVKLWLRELRDLECSAEDVLEEIDFESIRSTRLEKFKVELLRNSSGKRKHETGFLFFPSTSSLKLKIEKLLRRYCDVLADRKALRLREGEGVRRSRPLPLLASSSYAKSELLGREKDMNKVTELLLSDDISNGSVYSVIPIVGMAGVGKTALTQHIYQDALVDSKFDLKIWVWVSQEYDVGRVTCKMAQEILKRSCESSETNLLHGKMIEQLKDKRFLLVLDDVWDEDENRWESLMVPLNYGAKGSKIIVTTRSTKVARMMYGKMYHLRCLSDHNSWLVCQQQIFHKPNVNVDHVLFQIGKEIAARCRGSPLAAKALGSLLRKSIDEKHWTDVYENPFWREDEVADQIMPALQVSYDNLRMPLKRCFAYCSLFPKNHVFRKDKLVQLWVAQGFVDSGETSSLEYIGSRYFEELVSQCFFQRSPFHHDCEEMFGIHDLYHELAQFVSGKECSRTEGFKMCKVNKLARHSSLVPLEYQSDKLVQFDSCSGHNDLRTFLFLGNIDNKSEDNKLYGMKITPDLFLCLGSLRVLDLSNTDLKELPASIGNLIYLRHLGLENTRMECLPESLSGLINLQYINLKHCFNLIELPWGLKLLSNLRCLELPLNMPSCLHVPPGIGKLTNLQKLPLFVVGNDVAESGIEELGSLENLRGELHIFPVSNIPNSKFAEEANMRNKEKLQKLTLQWFDMNNFEFQAPSEILERLRPSQYLEELIIKGFNGNVFPTWLGNHYLSRLTTLELKNCGKTEQLPGLGMLPSLKHLSVQSAREVKHVGREFIGWSNGGFLVLETLSFRKMDFWEKWNGVGDADFPSLKYLTINRCSRLTVLPGLHSLCNLRIQHCELLHDLPVLPSLVSLKMEGFVKLRCLPPLPILNAIETLEIGFCKQLSSLGNLQHLVSLKHLEVSNCPLVTLQPELLPSNLDRCFVRRCCPLIDKLQNKDNFNAEADSLSGQEIPKFIKNYIDYSDCQCNTIRDDDLTLVEASCWYNNMEKTSIGISTKPEFTSKIII